MTGLELGRSDMTCVVLVCGFLNCARVLRHLAEMNLKPENDRAPLALLEVSFRLPVQAAAGKAALVRRTCPYLRARLRKKWPVVV